MKIGLMLLILFNALLFQPKSAVAINPSGSLSTIEQFFSGMPKAFVLKFISLSAKEIEKATGTHLNLKNKIALKLLQWKLKMNLGRSPGKENLGKFEKMGRAAMIFGVGAFLLLLIPFGSALAIPSAILAIVLGGISLNKVDNRTNSIIGIALGAAFLLLLVIALALVISAFSIR